MVETDRLIRNTLRTTSVAARRLGVNRQTLARYVREGRVRPTVVLPSGQARWSDEDIDAIGRAS